MVHPRPPFLEVYPEMEPKLREVVTEEPPASGTDDEGTGVTTGPVIAFEQGAQV